jgi:trimeric autotransporter adhesin
MTLHRPIIGGFFAWLAVALCSCQASPTLTGLTTAAPTPAPASVDVYGLVSTGESLSFNALTGGVNDLALNPIISQPAVAYYDKGSSASGTTAVGALKYAYRDATGNWTIEVVDANYGTAVCGTSGSYCVGAPNAAAGATASIIRLAFTSAGLPAIAYVYGASVGTASGFKQVRYAERSSAGTWTISAPFASSTAVLATNSAIAATVDAIKGLTLIMDSADRPHITFANYTQTILNSQLQYLFRSSAGAWTSSNIASAVAGAGTITVLGQGLNQAGGALCPSSGRPVWAMSQVDGAGGVSKALYIACSATDSNGACSTFNTLNLNNGCAGGTSCFGSVLTTASNVGSRMDLTIDAATQRPVIAAYATATPATTLLALTAPLSCEQTQTSTASAWGTPVTIGSGSAGANGFRLMSSNSTLNLNLIAYLTSTTTVLVNKSTGPNGAWLATGATVETTTVGGDGVGAVYDDADNVFYMSYASLPGAAVGAAGNDLKLASGMQEDIALAGAAGAFVLDNVDTMSTFFPSTAVPILASAKSAGGLHGFAAFFQDATTVADSKLYYGIRGGASSAPVFSMRAVVNHIESGASPLFVGSYPALAYDSADNPVIAFYNGVAAQQNLNVARSSNGGSHFSVTVVDDTTANVGQYPSLATYGTAIGVAYYDVTSTGLKFARYTPTLGWRRFAVDGMAGTGSCGNAADDAGAYASFKFTSTGLPVIAYKSNSKTKLAFASNEVTGTTYTWTCFDLEASANNQGVGIALELSATDVPHLVHFDATTGDQRYVTCPSSISSCVSSGVTAFTASLLTPVGTTATITTKPDLKINSAGTLYATFYSASYRALAVATLASGSSTWTLEYLDAAPTGVSFISAGGQYASLTLNSDGLPVIFYRSWQNWLKYFSRQLQ